MAETTKIKLLFATDGIFPQSIGGIQRHSRLLIEELTTYPELEIHVVHPERDLLFGKFETIYEHRIENITVSKNYLRECQRFSARVAGVIDSVNPDVIYAQGLTVWKDVSKFSARLINNPHGLESFQAIGIKDKLVGTLFKHVQRKIFRNSAYVVSEGGRLTDILINEGFKNKIVFLPNAVKLPEQRKQHYVDSNKKIRVFFMARFATNKGIHILMESIKKLNKEGRESVFEFVLGGKGPLFEHFLSSCRLPNVTFTGFLNDEELREQYLKADVFLLPTLFEGMPTVVLEAMSYAVPVIVTDVGATRELINKETGFLIQRNSADAVCTALKEFVELSEVRKRELGLNARNKVEKHFTWKVLAGEHMKLFKRIISDNSK